jgi:hypothetical protein
MTTSRTIAVLAAAFLFEGDAVLAQPSPLQWQIGGSATSDWTPVSVSFLVPTTATHIVVGVKPTVPMSPTIAGMRQERDEVLERAIGVIGSRIVP